MKKMIKLGICALIVILLSISVLAAEVAAQTYTGDAGIEGALPATAATTPPADTVKVPAAKPTPPAAPPPPKDDGVGWEPIKDNPAPSPIGGAKTEPKPPEIHAYTTSDGKTHYWTQKKFEDWESKGGSATHQGRAAKLPGTNKLVSKNNIPGGLEIDPASGKVNVKDDPSSVITKYSSPGNYEFQKGGHKGTASTITPTIKDPETGKTTAGTTIQVVEVGGTVDMSSQTGSVKAIDKDYYDSHIAPYAKENGFGVDGNTINIGSGDTIQIDSEQIDNGGTYTRYTTTQGGKQTYAEQYNIGGAVMTSDDGIFVLKVGDDEVELPSDFHPQSATHDDFIGNGLEAGDGRTYKLNQDDSSLTVTEEDGKTSTQTFYADSKGDDKFYKQGMQKRTDADGDFKTYNTKGYRVEQGRQGKDGDPDTVTRYTDFGTMSEYHVGDSEVEVKYGANGIPTGEIQIGERTGNLVKDGDDYYLDTDGDGEPNGAALSGDNLAAAREAHSTARNIRIGGTVKSALQGASQGAKLGGMSSLLLGDNVIAGWQEFRDQLFNNYILGGTDFLISRLCQHRVKKAGGNVGMFTTDAGFVQVGAFVAGERSEPITFPPNSTHPNGHTKYLYKYNFKLDISGIDDTNSHTKDAVQNGNFGVNLMSGKDVVRTLVQKRRISDGASALGENMIIEFSDEYYDGICIQFDRSIEFTPNNFKSSICSPIVSTGGAPTSYEASLGSRQVQGSG